MLIFPFTDISLTFDSYSILCTLLTYGDYIHQGIPEVNNWNWWANGDLKNTASVYWIISRLLDSSITIELESSSAIFVYGKLLIFFMKISHDEIFLHYVLCDSFIMRYAILRNVIFCMPTWCDISQSVIFHMLARHCIFHTVNRNTIGIVTSWLYLFNNKLNSAMVMRITPMCRTV